MIGQRFGKLVILDFTAGAKDRHSTVNGRCDCGEIRNARADRVRRGEISQCASCGKKSTWKNRPRTPLFEKKLKRREGSYKTNARVKGNQWNLSREQFRAIIAEPCRYCGISPSGGIDRIENDIGYIMENSAPCCATCNYAKRDMTEAQFLAWIKSAHDHLFRGK